MSNYAREGEVSAGDELIADDGFTCITAGATVIVQSDEAGTLYVPCSEGRHCLDGQLDDGPEYIGFTPANVRL